jgi:flagellar biosynthesis protein FliQ
VLIFAGTLGVHEYTVAYRPYMLAVRLHTVLEVRQMLQQLQLLHHCAALLALLVV